MGTHSGGILAGVAILFAACGGGSGTSVDGGGGTDSGPGETVTAVVGAAGGFIDGPAGVSVTIPPGALDEDTTITVSVPDSGFSELPAVASGQVVAFEPHGLTFAQPVTISLPHAENPNELAVFTSSPGGAWEKLVSEKFPTEMRVQVMHFSFFFNGREVCGLYRQECCADMGEGQCAGDALTCVSNRCLECGFEGEQCCGGNTCIGALTCGGGSCFDSSIADAGVPPDAAATVDGGAVIVQDAAPAPDAEPPPDAAPGGDASAMPRPSSGLQTRATNPWRLHSR